jgi:hypothetical protein
MMRVQMPVRKTSGEQRQSRVSSVKAWVSRAFFAFAACPDIAGSFRLGQGEDCR